MRVQLAGSLVLLVFFLVLLHHLCSQRCQMLSFSQCLSLNSQGFLPGQSALAPRGMCSPDPGASALLHFPSGPLLWCAGEAQLARIPLGEFSPGPLLQCGRKAQLAWIPPGEFPTGTTGPTGSGRGCIPAPATDQNQQEIAPINLLHLLTSKRLHLYLLRYSAGQVRFKSLLGWLFNYFCESRGASRREIRTSFCARRV